MHVDFPAYAQEAADLRERIEVARTRSESRRRSLAKQRIHEIAQLSSGWMWFRLRWNAPQKNGVFCNFWVMLTRRPGLASWK